MRQWLFVLIFLALGCEQADPTPHASLSLGDFCSKYGFKEPEALELPEFPIKLVKPPSRTWGKGTLSSPAYELAPWIEADAPSSGQFVLFGDSGLGGACDLFLAVDKNHDRRYESILPTGLSDDCLMSFFPEGGDLFFSGKPASLRIADPRVFIGHHRARYRYQAQWARAEMVGARYGLTTLTLPELVADADQDGLTDIAEHLLLLDPTLTDSDGDGLEDAFDPTPNVNPAVMGKLERGIARALLAQDVGASSQDWDLSQYPFEARFFIVHGAGPIAYAPPGRRGICLWQAEQQKAFALRGGKASHLTVEQDQWWEGSGPAPWGISLDGGGSGWFIELVERNGEFYPGRSYGTYIS